MDGVPEWAQRPRPAAVVPYARRNEASLPRDAPHLPKTGDGVGHEVDDELGERAVEAAVGEGQLLGRRLPDVDIGMSRPRCGDKRLRRVDRGHRLGAETGDELGGERARSAAHVDDGVPHPRVTEVRKRRARAGTNTGP